MGQRGPAENYGKPVRVPPDLHARLLDAAEERGVSMAWFMAKLLTEALDNLRPADEMRLTR